jgi:hydroxymethylbilane synthase
MKPTYVSMNLTPSHKNIVIGTRGSALALRQVEIVREALQVADPSITVTVQIITTRGDVNQGPIPLDTVGKGWFTQELEQALLDKSIDLAVHSLKDMAQDIPNGLTIGAYLPREDARDVLITKHGQTLEELPSGAIIGTDSIRRQVQMLAIRPDTAMQSLRGNVPTRIKKLATENYDAIILAAAGLKRLGLEDTITYYFEPHEMTPAPGQGILALEARADDSHILEILSLLHDRDTGQVALIERSFSQKMGGGCKSPTGAYAYNDGSNFHLLGMVAAADGSIMRRSASAVLEKSQTLGEILAEILLEELRRHG